MGIFKKLSWFFKKERKRYILGITFLALTSLANLIPPRILGLMSDQLDQGQITWKNYFIDIVLIILTAIFLYVLRFFWRKQIWGGAAELERQLRSRLFNLQYVYRCGRKASYNQTQKIPRLSFTKIIG